jgi:hypothetical protein
MSDNQPGFADIVIHSTATDLAAFPVIRHWCRSKADWHINPTLASPPSCLRGADDGVDPPKPSDIDAQHFTSAYEQRTIAGVGHNLPQETLAALATAVLALT